MRIFKTAKAAKRGQFLPQAANQGLKHGQKWEGSKDVVVNQIEACKDEILPYAEKATQSEAVYLFEMIPVLTDDDGANAEFDDILGFLRQVFRSDSRVFC